ncbi:DUF2059 domain-containing protein [Brevundimonas sp.]|jgi:hypothetical protein|uniref:DUF2059 domain-containing protein n=1 Tax=Brevundimonas sp. TaxID=1871086 RepID=UPI0037BE2148
MITIRTLGLALMLGAVAVSAQAQDQGGDKGRDDRLEVIDRPDPGMALRTALARELLEVSVGPNFAKEVERAMAQQLEKTSEQQGEEADWVRANMPPMIARMVGRMIDRMVPSYASIYTEEELRGQIVFYRSPVGQAVAAKTVTLGVALQDVQTEVAMSFLTEFQSKYCAQFDCPGQGGQVSVKPSRH